MLRAMKEQLKSLAKDENKEFHGHLRQKVGKKATALLEGRLKKIIVLLPDLVGRVYDYWRVQPHASQTKILSAYVLTYLYLPKDFLPEDEWGLYGYLDDAYLVAKVYTTILDEVERSGGKIDAADQKLSEEVKLLQKSLRIVIPKICEKIDEMIAELAEGKQDAYLGIFNNAGISKV